MRFRRQHVLHRIFLPRTPPRARGNPFVRSSRDISVRRKRELSARSERPRRGTSPPGIGRRTAAANRGGHAAEEPATGNERMFQLAAPAEMRRLCLSINMRRDKATRSFIRSSAAAASGSLGLGPARYVLSFITAFHAHFSSCPSVAVTSIHRCARFASTTKTSRRTFRILPTSLLSLFLLRSLSRRRRD